jgi:hypothetical protein
LARGRKLVALFAGEIHAGDERDDEPLERVVAERALELRDDDRPETAGGVRPPGSWIWVGVVAHTPKLTNYAAKWELKNFRATLTETTHSSLLAQKTAGETDFTGGYGSNFNQG